MWDVKNAINWNEAKVKYGEFGISIYYDTENYNRILFFVAGSENLAMDLDQLFEGDWVEIRSSDYRMLETHFLVTDKLSSEGKVKKSFNTDSNYIFDKVITRKEARDYYLAQVESMDLQKLTKNIFCDRTSNARFFITPNKTIDGCVLDLKLGGDWVPLSSLSVTRVIEVLGLLINPSIPKNNFSALPKFTFVGKGREYADLPNGMNKTLIDSLNNVSDLQYNPDDVKFATPVLTTFPEHLRTFLSSFSDLLNAKNKAYGNSALQPMQTFSKASSSDVILQQIDHKLSRIKNSDTPKKNDVIDLLGYLTIYCLDQSWFDLADILD